MRNDAPSPSEATEICPDCEREECECLTAEDIAYERAQASEAWERMGGGGL